MNPNSKIQNPKSEDLERRVRDLGFTRFGIADAEPPESLSAYQQWLDRGFHGSMGYLERHLPLKADPRHLLPGANSILVVGLDYNQPVSTEWPRVARYAQGRDYHRIFRRRLGALVRQLSAEHSEATFRITVDSAPILEREYAHRAGLGWFGKNTMLIDSRRGSWFLIGMVLTTLNLEPTGRSVGGCGSCRACIDACPTGAIVFHDDRWQIDARQCISYLTIEAPAEADDRVGDWAFGCDVCQEVCPFNHPGPRQPDRAPTTRDPDLLRPLTLHPGMDADAWDAATRGSALRRQSFAGYKKLWSK